ncbi:hypothetical protein HHK36_028598 [Tetracentron sinense]|uniref:Uncharacterized protein n=1 Tax=Tetracentron sinense TaxID=13715 RepID=A0A834YDN3_TETSI|nr:hypothetical protein HHK36_028598 [Tetracentron sinense]
MPFPILKSSGHRRQSRRKKSGFLFEYGLQIVVGFLTLKYQGKSETPFETNPFLTTLASLATIFSYLPTSKKLLRISVKFSHFLCITQVLLRALALPLFASLLFPQELSWFAYPICFSPFVYGLLKRLHQMDLAQLMVSKLGALNSKTPSERFTDSVAAIPPDLKNTDIVVDIPGDHLIDGFNTGSYNAGLIDGFNTGSYNAGRNSDFAFSILAVWGICKCMTRICRRPNCLSLHNVAEFDIQLETEECVKNSSSSLVKDGGGKGVFELGLDQHKELEAELRKMNFGRLLLIMGELFLCSGQGVVVLCQRSFRKP